MEIIVTAGGNSLGIKKSSDEESTPCTYEAAHTTVYNWRAGASQLNHTTGTDFLLYIYIYIYHGRCHTANRLRVSKLTQLTIFHTSSPRVYRHGDSSRRCTVGTVQDEANPSSSQPTASCCVASESTEAHRDGWQECVLSEESVLPRK